MIVWVFAKLCRFKLVTSRVFHTLNMYRNHSSKMVFDNHPVLRAIFLNDQSEAIKLIYELLEWEESFPSIYDTWQFYTFAL